MAKKQRTSRESNDEDEEVLQISEEPPTIDPYEVLNLEKEATADQIKSAYRKQALKHHPDKAAEADKATAHTKFQEIAFAYAVLSDERRRKRYDVTGRTDESLAEGDEDFDWSSFYREQYEDAITDDKIAAFAKEYKGSEEEELDVIKAYEEVKGDMEALYEYVMLSDPAEDEERFRALIDKAIEEDEIEAYDKYTKETAKTRKKRLNAAKKNAGKEAAEAEEMAKELGLKKSKGKKDDDMSDLKALIQQRQNSRAAHAGSFFDNLEAKYGAAKRGRDEPSEEAFAKNRKKKRDIMHED